MKKGFTLAEILVVTGIIIFLTALILPNYPPAKRHYALQRSIHKLAQDLRRVEEMAMSMEEFDCSSGALKGYGIKFEKDSFVYPYLALCDSHSEEMALEGKVEKGIKIENLKKDGLPVLSLEVFFLPPDPKVNLGGANEVEITLSTETGEKKSVKVNKAGLISIE